MTSISGTSASAMSPADRMQMLLQQAVAAGTVKSADQGALSSALTDIGAAMKSGSTSAAGTTPSSVQTKVDSLVDQEVSDGKLTSDQGDELKKVFADAAQKMHGGHHGHGGGHHAAAAGSTTDDPTSTTTDPTSTASSDPIDALIGFLQQLRQSTSSTTNYAANGTSASSAASAMLVDSDA